tara:strand:- start:1097 stop:1462 length:366 start_codon:yes stop_codon:yes gene_type:complete
MPKARTLTDVEKFYIQNHPQKSDEEIASQMSGIGPKTISKYRESETQQESPEHVTQTQSDRTKELGNGPPAGEFILNQRGSSIMTGTASEVTDARKVVKGTKMNKEEYDKAYKDKIHKPHG